MADLSSLKNVLIVPGVFEALTSEIDDLWASLGLSDTNLDIDVQAQAGDTPDPTPPEEDEKAYSELDEMDADDAYDLGAADDIAGDPQAAQGVAPPLATRTWSLGLRALSNVEMALPGIDGVKFVLNPGLFTANLILSPTAASLGATVRLAVRFAPNLLAPMRAVGAPEEGRFEPDPDAAFVEVGLGEVAVSLDQSGRVSIDSSVAIELDRPAMIGSTGVILETAVITFNLNGDQPPEGDSPDGAPDNWKGLLIKEAKIRIPSVFTGQIDVDKLGFGTGGVTGKVTASGLNGSVLGMNGSLTSVGLTLRENIPVEAAIAARVSLPFFDFPQPVDLAISIAIDGSVTAKLSGNLVTLERANFARFELKSLTVGTEHGTVFTSLSGALTPLVPPLTWPTFEIKELRIDSKGNVSLAGGWIDLPSQKTFSLYAFQVEITKIGFGTEDNGDRWIGFSGGVKLVDGLTAGASVEGLRMRWKDIVEVPRLSLEGLGVELTIPNALVLKGKVRLTGTEFLGAVTIEIPSLSLVAEGQFVTGEVDGHRSFAIFVHAELPAGIPLGQTDLAIFGLAGLYGQHRAPDKGPTEDWYQSLDGKPGWYLKGTPGVEDLSKWKGQVGSFAFGAGITIGTYADNGFKFNGRVLLVLILPGPTIFLDGRANLFKKRAALTEGEPNFRAFAVLDAGKSVLINLDAHYKYKDDGELIDMNGSAEAFFEFGNVENWHIYVGLKDDPKRRVSATAFKLFTGSGYFQLDARKMEIGSGWGFDESYGFDELNVHVFASMETAATVSWHPNHFTGTVVLDGGAEVRAFGHGVGIHVHADIQGDVFDPFHLKGSFFAGIDLPWPLPDLGQTINLEWTEPVSPPRLPLPLQEGSAEMAKRQLRWPFRRGINQFPNYDQGDLESAHGEAPPNEEFTFGNQLRVPADTKLGLTFSRPVDDVGDLGDQSTEVAVEVIGDPLKSKRQDGYRVGYVLSRARLEKLAPLAPNESSGSPLPPNAQGIGWVPVAQTGDVTAELPELFGGWTLAGPPDNPANPADPEAASTTNNAQAKLMIYARTPLDYTSVSSRDWEQWFMGANPTYPCVPMEPAENFVAVFTLPIGTTMGAPNFFIFIEPRFDVAWGFAGDITALDPPTVQGVLGPIDRGVRVAAVAPSPGVFTSPTVVRPPRGSNEVRIRVARPNTLQYQPGEDYGVFDELGPIASALNGTLAITTRSGANVVPSTVGTVGPDDEHRGVFVSTFQTLEFQPVTPALFVEMILFGEGTVSFEDPDAPPEAPAAARVDFYDATNPDPIHFENLVLDGDEPIVIRFAHPDIARIVVNAGDGANFVVERIHVRTPVRATARRADDGSTLYGPFTEVDGLITIKGVNLGSIFLTNPCGGEFVIVELSIPSRQDQRIKHTYASLARLTAADEVLEPDTDYRLTVTTHRDVSTNSSNAQGVAGDDPFTERLYFRTAALPGIGVPDVPEGTQTGSTDPAQKPLTGFEDLAFYVKRTVPAVPPPAGGHNSPARAAYRAYDANVEFSEETVYMERLYLLAKRDLTLRLFDANNLPLLDEDGRLVLASARWGQSIDPKIASSVQRWIGILNSAACRPTPPFDPSQVVRSEVIDAPSEEVLLAAETLHQTRLVPMLLHETFVNARTSLLADGQGFRLDRWHAEQNGPNPSAWAVQFETVIDPTTGAPIDVWFATETNQLQSALVYEGPLASTDDVTHPDHPSQWKDFRAGFQVRWQDGEVGFEMRRASSSDLVRLTMNRLTGVRRLVAIEGGVERQLDLDDQTPFPDPGFDLIVEIECVDARISVSERLAGDPSGAPILETTTAPTFTGTVALYTSGGVAPRFGDIRVDDLRANPSTAYRFDFITSNYSNFHHHVHSFDDHVFDLPEPPGISAADLDASLPVAVTVPDTTGSAGLGPVDDLEHRAFETLEQKVLGTDGRLRTPGRIEILRASVDPQLTALLVRSPEPLQWERTLLVPKATSQALALGIPGDLKLSAVAFGATPADESVTLLVRASQRLSGHRIEWRPVPDGDPDPAWSLYYEFGPELPQRDGSQVRVFSCSPSEAPPRRPGTTQRFVAADPADATTHFPSSAVELRVVAPGGAIVHQRRFLDGIDFADQEMRVVRKQDGTAFVLFLPPGTSPLTGTLRLGFTFARNAGPDRPRLTQAGDDGPEGATIDLEL
jgi:hypothetical protein